MIRSRVASFHSLQVEYYCGVCVPNHAKLEPAHGIAETAGGVAKRLSTNPAGRGLNLDSLIEVSSPIPGRSSAFPLEEPYEALLGKVAVVCKNLLNASLTHHIHRNAIHEAVLFVGPSFIEGQASEERSVRL